MLLNAARACSYIQPEHAPTTNQSMLLSPTKVCSDEALAYAATPRLSAMIGALSSTMRYLSTVHRIAPA
eukprot:2048036-Rhodomonas_salina.4